MRIIFVVAAVFLAIVQLSPAYSQQRFLVTLRSLDQLEDVAAADEPGMSAFVAQAADRSRKLSLPLLAAVASGGTLEGYTDSGDWIIAGPEVAADELRKSGLVSQIGLDAPPPREANEVNSVVLLYSLDDKPTIEELDDAGVQLIRDTERRNPDRPQDSYGYMKVSAPGKGIPAALAEKLDALDGVEAADASTSVTVAPIPVPEIAEAVGTAIGAESPPTNDPRWSELWGLRYIHAPSAWSVGNNTSPTVVVAVVDTGIDYEHEDLKDCLWTNPNEIPNDQIDNDNNGLTDDVHGADYANNDGDPRDDHGHGTHCAGIIAAFGNDGKGVVGVTWQAQLMALKFLRPAANGRSTGDLVDAADCITYAIDHGADIISNSWESSVNNVVLERVFKEAQSSGIIVVAAAGNGDANQRGLDIDRSPRYPAAYDFDNIVSVAAVRPDNQLTSFSNFGKKSVDLAAPGCEILSTYPRGISAVPYQRMSGTSMAAPYVSGALALMLANPKYRDLSAKQVIAAITGHVKKLTHFGRQGSRPALCTSEGILDLSFLGDSVSYQPPVLREGFRSAQFSYKDKKEVSVGGKVLLAEITLQIAEPVTLHIRSNSSLKLRSAARGDVADVWSGFTLDFPPPDDIEEVDWSESLRPVTVNAQEWVNFGNVFSVDVAAPGSHTIYWFVTHRGGEPVVFSSGSMLIDILQRSR